MKERENWAQDTRVLSPLCRLRICCAGDPECAVEWNISLSSIIEEAAEKKTMKEVCEGSPGSGS